MTVNRVALIVGVIIVIILLIWGFANLRPFLGNLLGGTKAEVIINEQTFKVDVADTPEKRENGLSRKNSMPEEQGMLFIFDSPNFYPFWMKEMQFPIDIIYINGDRVVTVYENVQPPADESSSLQIYKPTAPADKVLEINAGLAGKYGIKPETPVQINL